ncbi:MAG: hypothetical protein P4L81_04525 [Candidatus Pacebacteria bacterium]|nr:hypothetical protein [Candidatus Paceibacterota bacterium]
MDTPTQPTFIPHEAVSAAPSRRGGGGLAELALLVSIILFIISAALGVGVFLYTQYLQSSNQSKLSQINAAQQAFDPTFVQQMTRLDTRMNTAQSLITAHLAPTQIFAVLEQSTVQDIAFTSFTFSAANPQQLSLTMSGVAGSVNSVALQAQVFSQSGVITNPIFSNIDAQPDGVHFNFTGLINPSALSYESFVSGASSQSAQTQGQTQTQTQTQQTQQTPSTPASPFESGTASSTSH